MASSQVTKQTKRANMTRVLSKCLQEGMILINSVASKGGRCVRNGLNFKYLSTVTASSSVGIKDNPKLWVKSPYPDVEKILGVEMHEMIYAQMAKFGNIPALV